MENRRTFIQKSGLAAGLMIGGMGMSPESYARIAGANDRIRTAIMGCNRRYGTYVQGFKQCENVEIAYVCDVDKRRQDVAVAAVNKAHGYYPKAEKDIRKILEQKDVDAIFVSCPDHWHTPAACMALQAGKNVYLEKPLTHNPREGEILIEFQKKYPNLKVQSGNQQRSSFESQEIIQEIHKGAIGEVFQATAYYGNARDRVPNPQKVPVPEWLDWELFQGPAPRTDFLDIWADYNWHWYWNFGTAETGNNAMHELDIARWALQVGAPQEVTSYGFKNHWKDDGWVMYDTMDATLLYPGGKIIKWDCKCRNNYQTFKDAGGRGVIVYGSDGTVFLDRNGYALYDRGGKKIRSAQSKEKSSTTGLGGEGYLDLLHQRNFFASIRGTAQLTSPVEMGVTSTLLCHLINISYKEGNKPIAVDPVTGHLKDESLMKKHWGREYEKGWEPILS
ncbi:MAG: Gfo/Idh/MocA family oxidoreductase [Bacteroidales bacterium]|nr:Gfo/Idh/MocA family oxidoreductase [Bacteroidales bacterium]